MTNEDDDLGNIENDIKFDQRLKKKATNNLKYIGDWRMEKGEHWIFSFMLIGTYVSIFFFIFVLPFVSTPNWCLNRLINAYNDGKISVNPRSQFSFDCANVDKDNLADNMPLSGSVCLTPYFTSTCDICILSFFIVRSIFKYLLTREDLRT